MTPLQRAHDLLGQPISMPMPMRAKSSPAELAQAYALVSIAESLAELVEQGRAQAGQR